MPRWPRHAQTSRPGVSSRSLRWRTLLQAEAAKEPQPELHIRGDKAVRYEFVAQAMGAAQQAGLRKIGFITEPKI